jgi:hypothetical protein
MDLDRLAVQIEGLLANQLGPLGQIVPGLLLGRTAQISQTMLTEIVGKALEGLFIAPSRAKTVNPAIVLVIMPAGPKGNFAGDRMLSLGFRGAEARHGATPANV